MAAIGKERILDASGRVIAEREAIIPQSQIMAARMPVDGPPVVTLAFERNIMADGSMVVMASAHEADPGVAVALLGTDPANADIRRDAMAKGLPWTRVAVVEK